MTTPNKARDLGELITVNPDDNWMIDYIRWQRTWSQRTFGYGSRTGGIIKHIKKELQEIKEAPQDVDEWLDVAILALDGAWRAGHSPERVVQRLVALQERNQARTYPMPLGDDEPSEHIKEEPNRGLRTGKVARGRFIGVRRT